jgi:hypothetical protein
MILKGKLKEKQIMKLKIEIDIIVKMEKAAAKRGW